jgi:hypothetical protein
VATNELLEEYLTKAKEAEDHAFRCRDRDLRESWLRIALSYRHMAQRQLDRKPNQAEAEQFSPLPASKAKPQD